MTLLVFAELVKAFWALCNKVCRLSSEFWRVRTSKIVQNYRSTNNHFTFYLAFWSTTRFPLNYVLTDQFRYFHLKKKTVLWNSEFFGQVIPTKPLKTVFRIQTKSSSCPNIKALLVFLLFVNLLGLKKLRYSA